MAGTANITIPPDALEAFCRWWRVRELSLFGSVLGDHYVPDGDVDALLTFDEAAPWSLWDPVAMHYSNPFRPAHPDVAW